MAKLFAHLLYTDALPWSILQVVVLTEDDTTSSSRIFLKILFQEVTETMGMKQVKDRFADEFMQEHYTGLFPKENPRHTRFAINFFTSIGLGPLTYIREFLCF